MNSSRPVTDPKRAFLELLMARSLSSRRKSTSCLKIVSARRLGVSCGLSKTSGAAREDVLPLHVATERGARARRLLSGPGLCSNRANARRQCPLSGATRKLMLALSFSQFESRTLDPIFLLSQFEFWRPRRWQRFVSFHDVDGKHFRGLVPDP
jgi:hypothetical protein